ncbi:MAG: dienelactone hydrolase family protein [Nannocystales bacterium]
MARNGEMIEFAAGSGSAPGYLARPASGSGPGLVVLQEWWGLVDHIKDVADRFAAQGFVTLAPDLYRGDSTTDPDDAGRRMMALDIGRAGQDVASAVGHLRGLDAVTPKKVGVMGFCMGGQLALQAAVEHGDTVTCAVDFYGIHPSVQLDFAKLKVPVLAHFGKTDEFVDEPSARALVASIASAGGSIDPHFYEAGHAFFNDARSEAYDEASAKAAMTRTLDFLRAQLG